ncbi:hypothetical protein BFO01nite_48800 [Brevibacillus formosus]|uniref:Uncharacterized protein n=1 Tax=Brevibacillus formosus TaxID=54913 RepID=A0ABQ0TBU3_9BACL|nr:hypothetical protein BFO01nite_48800 [Brevibacillus formosus]
MRSQKRMASKLKEIVVAANSFYRENLRPDVGYQLLCWSARGNIITLRGKLSPIWYWQCPSVYFSINREWYRL